MADKICQEPERKTCMRRPQSAPPHLDVFGARVVFDRSAESLLKKFQNANVVDMSRNAQSRIVVLAGAERITPVAVQKTSEPSPCGMVLWFQWADTSATRLPTVQDVYLSYLRRTLPMPVSSGSEATKP